MRAKVTARNACGLLASRALGSDSDGSSDNYRRRRSIRLATQSHRVAVQARQTYGTLTASTPAASRSDSIAPMS